MRYAKLKKMLMAGVAVATVATGAVATAPTASAWTWSSNVHVAGHAGCNQMFDSPRLIQIWPGNGTYNQAGFDWLNNYGVDVHQINSPTTAWVQVTCDGLSGRYTYWRSFTMYRPTWGNQINVSFQG